MDKVKIKFLAFMKFHDNDSNGIGLYLVYNHVTNLGVGELVKVKYEGATFTISFKH
jgi:hypothetical protein